LNAIQALSQLSYGPTCGGVTSVDVRVRNSVQKVKYDPGSPSFDC
jgi:hypothetical protein